MLVLVSLWMRGNYNWQEAQWRAADQLLASGIPLRCIGATRHWTEYHGAFDDWLALTYPRFDHTRGDVSRRSPDRCTRRSTPGCTSATGDATYQVDSVF